VVVPLLPPRQAPRRTIDHAEVRGLGINLLGARNSALGNLVAEVPPPLVAELLGYSYQVTQRHADLAAQPWSRYVT
jgi:hypothetical protein